MDVRASEASSHSKPIRNRVELRPALIESYSSCVQLSQNPTRAVSSFNGILLGRCPALIESY
eukprot:2290468-Pyramimonas_sp.AAC.1